MKKTQFSKLLSVILCIVLIAAMALLTSGCGNTETKVPETEAPKSETTVLGEGEKSFSFVVVDKDGNETRYEIHTDKTIVGDALLEHELIAGDEGPYGLYVKSVTGITADYDVDKTYWAFYVDGEYAMSGVDTTEISDGAEYTLKVEKS